MLPIETLDKITATAIAANGKALATDTPAILMPRDYSIQSLEHLEANRARYRGIFSTESIQDYCEYVLAYSEKNDPQAFVDADSMRCETFFNLGNEAEPGHGDFRAQLTLKKTAAYQAVLNIIDRPLSQRELAEWLEDWNREVAVTDATGTHITTAVAAQKIRNITIKASAERTSSESNFSAGKSSMDSIEAAHEDQQPAELLMRAKPYEGLQEQRFLLRLSIITGDKPMLKLRWVQRESQEEAIAQDFKSTLKKEIGGVAKFSLGQFNPGK